MPFLSLVSLSVSGKHCFLDKTSEWQPQGEIICLECFLAVYFSFSELKMIGIRMSAFRLYLARLMGSNG